MAFWWASIASSNRRTSCSATPRLPSASAPQMSAVPTPGGTALIFVVALLGQGEPRDGL
jgi:hypothetical protein